MKPNSQSNTMLIDEIEKKKSQLTKKRKNKLNRLTYQICNPSHETGTTQ
jgi:hypothetical protein